jgi:hypothetical protein
LSLKRNRCVVIAIRFFVNLIVSIDLDKLLIGDRAHARLTCEICGLGLGGLCLFD